MATPALLYVFPTYAAAISALGAGVLPDGARVEVERDENQTPADRRYRYDASVPGTGPSDLVRPEPFATLDDDGRLVERLSPEAAGVLDAADYASLTDAIAAANQTDGVSALRLSAGGHLLTGNATLGPGVELLADPGGMAVVGTFTLTLTEPLQIPRRQIFDCGSGGGVVFDGPARGPVLVEWFGVLPGRAPAEAPLNDAAMQAVLDATTVDLGQDRTAWLPVSFGWGNYEFGVGFDLGERAMRGQGHLVKARIPLDAPGYNRPFGGTVLRWRALDSGEAAITVSSVGGATPMRSGGFALIGPEAGAGLRLSRAIEASFVDVCIANFHAGIDVCDAQGCSFERLDVFGCLDGLLVRACPTDEKSTRANANTITHFNFNDCYVAIRATDLGAPAVDEELARRTSQWRFFGGTIQGGDADTQFRSAAFLGPDAKGFLFVGVWFELNAGNPGIVIDAGEAHVFIGCRFSDEMEPLVISGDGPGGHVFRDCYAGIGGQGTVDVSVSGNNPVTFDNCTSFVVADTSGVARIVGGYDPRSTAPDALDRMPARVGFDQDKGLIPWTQAANAPLQFTSVKNDVSNAVQVLLRASERVGDQQVSLWTLQTSGANRQKVRLHKKNGALVFEFDLAGSWQLTPAVEDPVSESVLIANLRQRQAEMETIIRSLVKQITAPSA